MVTRGSPKPLLRVRVLLPLPNKNDPALVGSFLFSFKGKKDLNGAGVNDVPVARSRRPDRRVSSEEKESFCQKSGIFRAALFHTINAPHSPAPEISHFRLLALWGAFLCICLSVSLHRAARTAAVGQNHTSNSARKRSPAATVSWTRPGAGPPVTSRRVTQACMEQAS